jgi:uncharacterized membrane protein YfcA
MILELVGLAILGLLAGVIATLVGTGGGYMYVPLLLFLYPEKRPDTITAMSLLVVLASGTSGSLAYAWQRRIDFVSGGWFALATLPGAVLGALLVSTVPRGLFNGIFAVALAGVGVWLLLPRPVTMIRPPLTGRGVIRRLVRDRMGQNFLYSYRLWHGIAIGSGIGFFSSLLGIGGGIMYVPAMAVLLHFPVHIATATSQFVAAVMALEATGVHAATGVLAWDRSLVQAAAVAAGALGGAQVGARLAPHVRGDVIVRVLGGALLVVAGRLLSVAL